jgi:hypothetical protein
MTSNDTNEPILRILSRLPAATPDASRSERVRARCHAVLARRQRKEERARNGAGVAPRVIESALVGGFCLCYVSAVILDALLSQGLL